MPIYDLWALVNIYEFVCFIRIHLTAEEIRKYHYAIMKMDATSAVNCCSDSYIWPLLATTCQTLTHTHSHSLMPTVSVTNLTWHTKQKKNCLRQGYCCPQPLSGIFPRWTRLSKPKRSWWWLPRAFCHSSVKQTTTLALPPLYSSHISQLHQPLGRSKGQRHMTNMPER